MNHIETRLSEIIVNLVHENQTEENFAKKSLTDNKIQEYRSILQQVSEMRAMGIN